MFMGFPSGSAVRILKCRDTGSIPGWGRSPWRRAWQPTPVFLLEKSHGQRSLANYSSWGHEELDTTEAMRSSSSVQSSTVSSSQNMEATEVSFSRREDKEGVVRTYGRILLSHKKDESMPSTAA